MSANSPMIGVLVNASRRLMGTVECSLGGIPSQYKCENALNSSSTVELSMFVSNCHPTESHLEPEYLLEPLQPGVRQSNRSAALPSNNTF